MRTPALLPIAILAAAMSASVAITAIRHANNKPATARAFARVTVLDYAPRVIEGDARTFKYDGHTFVLDVVPANSGIFKNGFERK